MAKYARVIYALLLDGLTFLPTTVCFVAEPCIVRSGLVKHVKVAAPSTAVKPLLLVSRNSPCKLTKSNNDMQSQEYRNGVTQVLSNFMQPQNNVDPLAYINFDAPKQPILNIHKLAQVLDYELVQNEWFVTGKVNPVYFSNEFQFQDPDVKLAGIEAYARGVCQLFEASSSRAEIISTAVVNATVITCTWRLSGRVTIGPAGLAIKPYVVYTDYTVEDGLVVFQQDRFSIPQWDILLSALFPFLIGTITQPPAPQVEPRVVKKPAINSMGANAWMQSLVEKLQL
jgi:hypothetical protein